MKRVVYTSTVATIWTDQAEPRTFSERDWNEMTMPKIEAGERDYMSVYFGSKILAEKGAPFPNPSILRPTSKLTQLTLMCSGPGIC